MGDKSFVSLKIAEIYEDFEASGSISIHEGEIAGNFTASGSIFTQNTTIDGEAVIEDGGSLFSQKLTSSASLELGSNVAANIVYGTLQAVGIGEYAGFSLNKVTAQSLDTTGSNSGLDFLSSSIVDSTLSNASIGISAINTLFQTFYAPQDTGIIGANVTIGTLDYHGSNGFILANSSGAPTQQRVGTGIILSHHRSGKWITGGSCGGIFAACSPGAESQGGSDGLIAAAGGTFTITEDGSALIAAKSGDNSGCTSGGGSGVIVVGVYEPVFTPDGPQSGIIGVGGDRFSASMFDRQGALFIGGSTTSSLPMEVDTDSGLVLIGGVLRGYPTITNSSGTLVVGSLPSTGAPIDISITSGAMLVGSSIPLTIDSTSGAMTAGHNVASSTVTIDGYFIGATSNITGFTGDGKSIIVTSGNSDDTVPTKSGILITGPGLDITNDDRDSYINMDEGRQERGAILIYDYATEIHHN